MWNSSQVMYVLTGRDLSEYTGYRISWLSPNDTFVCMFHPFPMWKESFRLWKVFCVWKCQIPLCRVASFPSVASPVYPKMALLPNDYYHLVTCPEVVTISDNQCSRVGVAKLLLLFIPDRQICKRLQSCSTRCRFIAFTFTFPIINPGRKADCGWRQKSAKIRFWEKTLETKTESFRRPKVNENLDFAGVPRGQGTGWQWWSRSVTRVGLTPIFKRWSTGCPILLGQMRIWQNWLGT